MLNRTRGPLGLLVVFVALAYMPAAFAVTSAGTSEPPVRLLSAFFGLDNALPFRANLLCLGASGADGMPVVLSHTIDPETLEAEDFQVVTRSGRTHTPHCVTLRPAQDPGELRTVLLIGEFGNANDDPPTSVQIVGDLLADGSYLLAPGSPLGVQEGSREGAQEGARERKQANFRGLDVAVTPLDAGPFLVLAQRILPNNLAKDTRGTACPEGVQQVVRVTWAGGVRLPNRDELGDAERQLYRVAVKRANGSTQEVVPVALADLEDGDNNHLLCLDTTDVAVAVSFPAGHLVDPNQDLNPDTHISVSVGVN